MRQLSCYEKLWPVAGSFTISRSSLTHIPTIWVEITENGYRGRAECRPYARYGDTVDSVISDITTVKANIEKGVTIEDINALMRPGPARNAIDCALWDLKAKMTGKRVFDLLGLKPLKPRQTAYTLSLQSPDDMADSALNKAEYALLKLKVDRKCAIDCTKAVLAARPEARLIIDANEGLSPSDIHALANAIPTESIEMLEQPIPSSVEIRKPLPATPIICADESLHSDSEITRNDLEKLWSDGYRAVNIKLDKCGGLTAALSLMKLAKEMEFKIMAGCMVGSSLAMAPMLMLESYADILDLDGPLLLSDDCDHSLKYSGSTVYPPKPELWG